MAFEELARATAVTDGAVERRVRCVVAAQQVRQLERCLAQRGHGGLCKIALVFWMRAAMIACVGHLCG